MIFTLSSARAVLPNTVHPAAAQRKVPSGQRSRNSFMNLHRKNPVIEYNIFRSVENVNLNTVIGYKQDGVRHNFLDTYDEQK